jgi:hypothetical protein
MVQAHNNRRGDKSDEVRRLFGSFELALRLFGAPIQACSIKTYGGGISAQHAR